MSWADGRLTKAVIHSKSGLPCRVFCGDQSGDFDTAAGKPYPRKLLERMSHSGETTERSTLSEGKHEIQVGMGHRPFVPGLLPEKLGR